MRSVASRTRMEWLCPTAWLVHSSLGSWLGHAADLWQRLMPKTRAILHNSHYAHELNDKVLRRQSASAHPQKPDSSCCVAEDVGPVPRPEQALHKSSDAWCYFCIRGLR